MSCVDENRNDCYERIEQPLPENDQEEKRKLSKREVVNRLNFINFQDGTIAVNLKHKKYNSIISLKAKPLPCLDDTLHCTWSDDITHLLKSYQYLNFKIPDNQKLITVEAELQRIDESGVSFILPDQCYEVMWRRVKRYYCEDIKVQLVQSGAMFHGNLIDFSPVSFRIELSVIPPQTFQWLDLKSPVVITLTDCCRTIYSGECNIIRQSGDNKVKMLVLQPLHTHMRRFSPKKYRSARYNLVPSPNISFVHPLTKKIVERKVLNISGSGFAVEEEASKAVLLPGMMIPELDLRFAQGFHLRLKAQVVYTNKESDCHNKTIVRCGLAIIDMEIGDHVKLLAFLQQANDRNSYLCNHVDMEVLWNFFFETGFIYPQKYRFIENSKEEFKQLYERLYTQNPSIARHFVYQEDGVILAHMAMLRFYENTWLIHHHAANKAAPGGAGVAVLNQLSRSIIDCHSLYSAHMQYLVCYFRPDNKFPQRIFGGVAKYLDNRKACSIDSFAYYHFLPDEEQLAIMGPWKITESQRQDLCELQEYYEHTSGGLLITALNLEPDRPFSEELCKEYKRLGFKREESVFSVKRGDDLKAVMVVNRSDIGLNMSDLTNCITVFVLEPREVSKDTIDWAISTVSSRYQQKELTILLYPSSYMDYHAIQYDKLYNMFIISTQYSDPYFEFLKAAFKLIKKA